MPDPKVELPSTSEDVVNRHPKRWLVGAMVAGLVVLVTVAVVLTVNYTSGVASQGSNKSKLTYTAEGLSNEDVEKRRLPRSLQPLHYNVELQSYLLPVERKSFPFKGNVSIWMKCTEATNRIILHASRLQIKNDSLRVRVQQPGQNEPKVVSYEMTSEEFLVLNLDRDLKVNKQYVLEISFSGLHNDYHSMGFYTSGYFKQEANDLYTATQFQPIMARTAFPCFDEPALKSTFNVTLVRPSNFSSLSNTEIIESGHSFTEENVTFVKDVYGTSPYMSTYLLAFFIGTFDHLSQTTKSGVKIRTWSLPALVNSTQYVLNISVQLLDFFEDFCNISYQIPKLDMIGLPWFKIVAMENWGLIKYKQRFFLYTKGVTLLREQELISRVVSHELAHQWFGNLVTLKWWDDFWLNEGFSTYMETLGLDHIYSDRDAWNRHVVTKMFNAMDFDNSGNTRPVHSMVAGTTNEILNTLPGEIVYIKAAALIRMMSYFLGLNNFNTALRLYLKQFAFSNVESDDLWKILTQHSTLVNKPLNVKDIMDPWIHQTSYPLVTVARINGSTHSLYLTQEPFTSIDNQGGFSESQKNPTWNIPLTFVTRGTMREKHDDLDIIWMWKNETNKIVTLNKKPGISEDSNWVLSNIYHSGYYRVNYDVDNWMALCVQLKDDHEVIPTLNRAQIINDAWTLAKIGQLPVSVAMATLDYLHKERDYNVWQVVDRNIQYISTRLAQSSVFNEFTSFMRCKLNAAYKRYSLRGADDSFVEKTARMIVSKLACQYRLNDCLQDAHRQFTLWMSNSDVNPIDVNFREIVYCSAISFGGLNEWEFALKMSDSIFDGDDSDYLKISLSCTQVPDIINRILNMALNDSTSIYPGFYYWPELFNKLARNPESRPTVWNFCLANSERLSSLYGNHTTETILRSFTETLNSQTEFDQIKELSRANHLVDCGIFEDEIQHTVVRTQYTRYPEFPSEEKHLAMFKLSLLILFCASIDL